MAQIVVSSEEFANVVACYLFDAITRPNDEIILDNPLFIQLIERMKRGGMRAYLLHTYLSMDANTRIKYKYIADTLFNDSNSTAFIRVLPTEEEEPED